MSRKIYDREYHYRRLILKKHGWQSDYETDDPVVFAGYFYNFPVPTRALIRLLYMSSLLQFRRDIGFSKQDQWDWEFIAAQTRWENLKRYGRDTYYRGELRWKHSKRKSRKHYIRQLNKRAIKKYLEEDDASKCFASMSKRHMRAPWQ